MKFFKKVFIYVAIYIVMICLFSISMIAAYALPNERIRDNIKESEAHILMSSGNNNPLFGSYITGMQLDAFTDMLILDISINKGKSEDEAIVNRAFENSWFSENDNMVVSIEESLYNDDVYNNYGYSRYWHGIQIIVRPLLLVFNYEEIKALFMIVMFVLLGIAMMLIKNNLSALHAIGFLISMVMVGFSVVSISLQYIGIFAITLMTVIIINVLYKHNKDKLFPYLFFIVGGCTTFFDLLTAPIITLGLPLILIIMLKIKREKDMKLMSIIKIMIGYSILWVIAYAVTFVTKWGIASLVLHRDEFTVAVNQLLFRVNGTEEYPTTKIGAIKENLKFLKNKIFVSTMFVLFIIWIPLFVKYRKKIKEMKSIICICLIAIYPYIWYVAFSNHSTIHAWFTYRAQVITIFGFLGILSETIDFNKIRIKNNNNALDLEEKNG